MSRPRTYRTEALVLKTSPLGEAGSIVTLYSRDVGKLRAAVRGVRKSTSKLGGHLQPLSRVALSLASARNQGMDTVTQAQMLEGFASLKNSLEGVSRGIYVAELVDGFGAEGSASPQLYALACDTLRTLDRSPEEELALRCFELHILRCSGFMPHLYRCVECGSGLSPGEHLFSPEMGGTMCLRCTPTGARVMSLSVQALKVLRYFDRAVRVEPVGLRVSNGLAAELKGLLSATLDYWLDREIRSKKFIEHLGRSPRSGVHV